jgi:hypothetical protein
VYQMPLWERACHGPVSNDDHPLPNKLSGRYCNLLCYLIDALVEAVAIARCKTSCPGNTAIYPVVWCRRAEAVAIARSVVRHWWERSGLM